MKVFMRHMVLIMFVWLMLVGVCLGQQVYLKDGGIIEGQSAWKQGDKVFVKINRDIIADFNLEEIDLGRTFPKAKPAARHPRRKVAARKASASLAIAAPAAAVNANAAKPLPAAVPAQVATAPAVAQPPKTAVQPPPASASVASESPAPVAAPITPAESSADKAEVLKKALEMQRVGMPQPGGASLIILSLIILAVSLLIIAAHWIIFKKAGEAGWKSLVPLYNMYVLMKIAGKPGWWMFLLFVPLVGFVIFFIAMISLAKKFSRSELFGAGIFLLPVIFLPVLAFGGSEYEG